MPRVQPARTVSSSFKMADDSTQFPMVPTDPAPQASLRPSTRHRWWAVPLALLGLAVPAAVIVTNGIQVDHWAFAPGLASPVDGRLSFDNLPSGVEDYHDDGEFFFVTVTGAHLNLLQYTLGRKDNDVRFLTKEQRFGKSDPKQERQIDLQMMRDAKEVAEYVAYQRLGLDAHLKAGAVVVEQVLCLNGATTNQDDCDQTAPAGEYLQRGATITSINGVKTPTVDELAAVMADVKPGADITVTYTAVHDEAEKTATFPTMATKAEAGKPSRALVGFIAHDTYSVELPFRANIDTDAIGGPSAGLAFTLTLIDRLSPGSLTGGKRIAVTGTIQDDGTVGAIGGLRQKVAAVRQAGVKVFLVPTAQGESGLDGLAEARAAAGDEVEIVPVATLDEALAALAARGGSALKTALSA